MPTESRPTTISVRLRAALAALAACVASSSAACEHLKEHAEHVGVVTDAVGDVLGDFGGDGEPAAAPGSAPAAGTPGGPAAVAGTERAVRRPRVASRSVSVCMLVADDAPLPGPAPLKGVRGIPCELNAAGKLVLLVAGAGAQSGKPWSGVWVGEDGDLALAAATGDAAGDLEIMGVERTYRGSEMRTTGFAPARIADIPQVWLANDGSVGFRATFAGIAGFGGFCEVTGDGFATVAIEGNEQRTRWENVYADAARSAREIVRGVDSAGAARTESGEFLLLKGGRTALVGARAGRSRVILQNGQPAPGLPPGIAVAAVMEQPVACGASALVSVSLSGPGLTTPVALYRDDGAGLELLGRLPLGACRVGGDGRVGMPEEQGELVVRGGGEPAVVQTAEGRRIPFSSVKGLVAGRDGALTLHVTGASEAEDGLWAGPAGALEKVAIPAVDAGGAPPPPPRSWKADGDFLALVSGETLLAGTAAELEPVLRLRARVEVAPGDARVLDEMELVDVSARGDILVRARFAAEEGIRDATRALLLVSVATDAGAAR